MINKFMQNIGKIKRIIGPVVDVIFEGGVPDIYTALSIDNNGKTIVLEVEQHIGENTVRAVAMDSTDGLSRGMDVTNTGKPISVPVGGVTLGRMFNVLGAPIDGGDMKGVNKELPIHRKAPS